MKHVKGEKREHIVLYALSTCVWCQKTKRLLQNLGVDYHFVDVDLLNRDEREKITEEIKRWNPKIAFPTIVINGKKCVIGYDEQKIKEAVGL